MQNVVPLSRYRFDGKFWIVEVMAPVPGAGWIMHMLYHTPDKAKAKWRQLCNG